MLNTSRTKKDFVLKEDQIFYVRSGKYTARYHKGKYIVNQPGIDYNQYHRPISHKLFMAYWEKASEYLKDEPFRCYQVGQHSRLNVHVNVQTELHWHQELAKLLFSETIDKPLSEWTLKSCPSLELSEEHPVFIGISYEQKKVLICGTGYGGEMKKAMFTVMNTLLPKYGALPMHCSAVLSDKQETSLLLGLSGTGKTTLSSAPGVTLIGDDENVWATEGVFNLENGCYAKIINLSKEDEGEIFSALKAPCILENVVIKNDIPDFFDDSVTENIRAAYPLSNLDHYHKGTAPHPKHIIFLCCDLYGVMPAVSLLTPKQALQHYLIGYTAKVGSTEVDSQEKIMPVSSPCFGHPFFPLPLQVYASLFKKKLEQYQPKVWLVNTGWHNCNYQTGKRISLKTTKDIIRMIINHQVGSDTKVHPLLDLNYVAKIGDLDLDFSQKWLSDPLFSKGCDILQALFKSQEVVLED